MKVCVKYFTSNNINMWKQLFIRSEKHKSLLTLFLLYCQSELHPQFFFLIRSHEMFNIFCVSTARSPASLMCISCILYSISLHFLAHWNHRDKLNCGSEPWQILWGCHLQDKRSIMLCYLTLPERYQPNDVGSTQYQLTLSQSVSNFSTWECIWMIERKKCEWATLRRAESSVDRPEPHRWTIWAVCVHRGTSCFLIWRL